MSHCRSYYFSRFLSGGLSSRRRRKSNDLNSQGVPLAISVLLGGDSHLSPLVELRTASPLPYRNLISINHRSFA